MDAYGSMKFLKPMPEYRTTKPYSIDYRIGQWEGNIPRSNYRSQQVDNIQIKDVRGFESDFTFDKNGFAIIELGSDMSYDDFAAPQIVDTVYCEEVASCLLRYFQGAAAVQIYDVEIRRRHPLFPNIEMKPGMTSQPAQRVHIDGTQKSCHEVLAELGDPACQYQNHAFINVWRPLKGPLFDWPLAFCDALSVSAEDLDPHDHVFDQSVRENVMVYYNKKQQWYYLSGQKETEILLLRQADSDGRPGVPHSAFDLGEEAGGDPQKPRESIEVRAIVCFN